MREVTSAPNRDVFLNVPFDKEYEKLFTYLVGGLVGLGQFPRCAAEIADTGQGRLEKITALMSQCGASIHDLSRVSLSNRVPRFNIPFELGVAYQIRSSGQGGDIFIFEEKPFRLQISLSDLNGFDPQIHDGTGAGIVRCLLNCFDVKSGNPEPGVLRSLVYALSKAAQDLRRDNRSRSLFEPVVFRQLVEAANQLAHARKLNPGQQQQAPSRQLRRSPR